MGGTSPWPSQLGQLHPVPGTDLQSVAPGTGVLFGLAFWGRLGSQLPRADGSPSQASAGAQGTPTRARTGPHASLPPQEASGSLWVWPGLLAPAMSLLRHHFRQGLPGGAGTQWGSLSHCRSVLGRPLWTLASPPTLGSCLQLLSPTSEALGPTPPQSLFFHACPSGSPSPPRPSWAEGTGVLNSVALLCAWDRPSGTEVKGQVEVYSWFPHMDSEVRSQKQPRAHQTSAQVPGAHTLRFFLHKGTFLQPCQAVSLKPIRSIPRQGPSPRHHLYHDHHRHHHCVRYRYLLWALLDS